MQPTNNSLAPLSSSYSAFQVSSQTNASLAVSQPLASTNPFQMLLQAAMQASPPSSPLQQPDSPLRGPLHPSLPPKPPRVFPRTNREPSLSPVPSLSLPPPAASVKYTSTSSSSSQTNQSISFRASHYRRPSHLYHSMDKTNATIRIRELLDGTFSRQSIIPIDVTKNLKDIIKDLFSGHRTDITCERVQEHLKTNCLTNKILANENISPEDFIEYLFSPVPYMKYAKTSSSSSTSNNSANINNPDTSTTTLDASPSHFMIHANLGLPTSSSSFHREFVHARKTQESAAPQPFLLPPSAQSAMQTSSSSFSFSSSSSSLPESSTSQPGGSITPSFTSRTQLTLTKDRALVSINGMPKIEELRKGGLEPVDDRIDDILAELFKNTILITEKTLDAVLAPTPWSLTAFNLGKMEITPVAFRAALFPSTSTAVSAPAMSPGSSTPKSLMGGPGSGHSSDF